MPCSAFTLLYQSFHISHIVIPSLVHSRFPVTPCILHLHSVPTSSFLPLPFYLAHSLICEVHTPFILPCFSVFIYSIQPYQIPVPVFCPSPSLSLLYFAFFSIPTLTKSLSATFLSPLLPLPSFNPETLLNHYSCLD